MSILLQIPFPCFYLSTILLLLPPKSFLATAVVLPSPHCIQKCGKITVPFPFGLTRGCSLDLQFYLTCNHTFDPPKLFIYNSNVEVIDVSLDGHLKVLQFIAHECYYQNQTVDYQNSPEIHFASYLTVSNTANKFTAVGCDTKAFVSGKYLQSKNYRTGCVASCSSEEDLVPRSCMGLGCCQTSIPKNIRKVTVQTESFDKHSKVWNFNKCSYAFVAEEGAFNFSVDSLTELRNVEKLPMVVDWAIGSATCEQAGDPANVTDYVCVSNLSKCDNSDNGFGYRCSCDKGYEGNPYLMDGCHDIDECEHPHLNNCSDNCKNTPGSYQCSCPIGYQGDGLKDGQRCIRDKSFPYKLVAGTTVGSFVLFVALCWFYWNLRGTRRTRRRERFFQEYSEKLLQHKPDKGEQPSDAAMRFFSETELLEASHKFDKARMLDQGRYGIVYKGILQDNKAVAIMKTNEMDLKQVDQLIKEIDDLFQIDHPNIAKLLGCCLETKVPQLVYEFTNSGTLSEHIHDKIKASKMTWDFRLKIAAETAEALSFLHSRDPIILHGDVKSGSILLDQNYTAKLSIYGALKFVHLNESQLSTGVQMDPEYNQLMKKSDVYSFGMVLLELITGKKDENIASLFHCDMEKGTTSSSLEMEDENVKKEEKGKTSSPEMVKEEEMGKTSLLEMVDKNVEKEGWEQEIKEVAALAERCLIITGKDRPSMDAVKGRLEGLRKKKRGSEDDKKGEKK